MRFKTTRSLRRAGGALLLLTLGTTPAHAQYLDPGAGSVLAQVIIAVVVGVLATAKLYWGRITGLFGRGSKKRGS